MPGMTRDFEAELDDLIEQDRAIVAPPGMENHYDVMARTEPAVREHFESVDGVKYAIKPRRRAVLPPEPTPPPPPEYGFVTNFIRSAQFAGSSLVAGAYGLYDPEAQRLFQANLKDEVGGFDPNSVGGTLGSVAGNVIPIVAASFVASPFAVAVGAGASAAGQKRGEISGRRLQGQDISTSDEWSASLGHGAAEVIGEYIGVSAAAKMAGRLTEEFGKRLVSESMLPTGKIIKNVLYSAGVNAGEEVVTQIAQNAVQRMYIDHQQKLLEGSVMAGVQGALGGVAQTGIQAGIGLAGQAGEQTQGAIGDNQGDGQGQVPGQEQVGQEPVQAVERVRGGEAAETGGRLQAQEGEVTPPEPGTVGEIDNVLPDLPPPENLLRGGREAGSAAFFQEAANELVGVTVRAATATKNVATGLYKTARKLTARAADYMEQTGPTGKELGGIVRKIDLQASQRSKSAEVDIRDILKGANLKTREQIGMAINGRLENPSAAVKARADRMREVLDKALLIPARELGFERTLPGGEKVLVGGSGRAMPQTPNAKGMEILTEAKNRELASVKVATRAKEMVDSGKAASIDDALTQMKRYYDSVSRGMSPYLERSRTDFLKDDEIEWDPSKVLTGLLERTSVIVEAARELGGPDLPNLDALLMRMKSETDLSSVDSIDRYLKHEFGKSANVDQFAAKAAGAFSNYISGTKLGFSLTSMHRNSNQRYANAFDYPVGVLLKTVGEYPPFFNQWIKSAQAVKSKLESLGVVRSTSELGNVETGVPGRQLTDAALKGFSETETNNQTFAAILARNAVEADIHRLVKAQGENGPLARLLNQFLTPVSQRRLKRLGVTDVEALSDKVASGERLSFEEVQEAMNRAVLDTQFALTLATKPLWWSTNPWLRLLFKFKTFGTRQIGLIHNVAFKELLEGNPAPMGKFIAYMILTGELYNILRDLLSGREESLTMETINRPDRRNPTDIAARLFADFADGGGLGLLADTVYGLGSFAGGPAYSVVKNASEAVMDVKKRPSQVLTALRRFAEKEVSVVKQLTFLNHIDKAAFNSDNELIANVKWRRRAYQFRDEGKDPSLVSRAFDRAIEGFKDYGRGDKTLAYEYAARQVDVGDIDDAADYLESVFSDAKNNAELAKLVRGARISMNNRSPLGPIARKDRGKFLKPFGEDQAREAMRLQAKFISGYSAAIKTAASRVQAGNNGASQPVR